MKVYELFKTILFGGRFYHLWSDGSLTEGLSHHVLYEIDAPQEIIAWVNTQEATYKCNTEKGCWELTGFIHKGHQFFTVKSITTPSLGFTDECVATYGGNQIIPFV